MIPRSLWYHSNDTQKTIQQYEILEINNPIVILGEAGIGKSCLLEWLGSVENYAYCTARQLLNRVNPRSVLGDNSVLVIDALDEISSKHDGDSVDKILQKLEILEYPKFILACRVADWKSATSLQAIKEQYSEPPLELYLNPFAQKDMAIFLEQNFSTKRAQEIITHFTAKSLDDLLGNPQTLSLIAKVAIKGELPESLTQLFEQAIEILRAEHSEYKSEAQLPSEVSIDAAGAAFASLILTGNEAISRKSIINLIEGELPISEIKQLPNTEKIDLVLGSRLFRSNGAERFTYIHRRIGEFLGAKWLVKLADTNRKRKRLLSLFHSHEFVPSNLRGLHSWLLSDPALVSSIIKADPIGILEYGDVGAITVEQAQSLLNSIQDLAENNPSFYNFYNRNGYSIRAFTKPIILSQIQKIIIQPDIPFGFRIFLIDAIKGYQLPNDFIQILTNIINDSQKEFAIRKSAGEALAVQEQFMDWHSIYTSLFQLGDESSIRLAIELLDDTGYNKTNDDLIANLAISYLKMNSTTVGTLWYLQENLPLEQIEYVLNFFIKGFNTFDKDDDSDIKSEAKNFAYRLILRFIENYAITPKKLWEWLEPFGYTYGYQDKSIKELAEYLKSDYISKQALQYMVLLDLPHEGNIWQRAIYLSSRSSGLALTTLDLISILKKLYLKNSKDIRWKEIVQLTRHDAEIGKEVREAALPFTLNSKDDQTWLNQISAIELEDWQIKDIERKKQREINKTADRAKQRLFYIPNINRLCQGEYELILTPAKVYLGLFTDISKEIPAHERISDWIGSDISEACMQGFEENLIKNPPDVNAQDIATILPQSRYYEASFILIVGLAERVRNSKYFSDLPDEKLVAAYLFLSYRRYDEHAGINNLYTHIVEELKKRKIFKEAIQAFYEPHFKAQCTYIHGLSQFMRKIEYAELGTELATNWLNEFKNLNHENEKELADCLLHNGKFEELKQLIPPLDLLVNEERRKYWISVNILINFKETINSLGNQPIDKSLIWTLRDRITGRHRENHYKNLLNTNQLEWIIATFRKLWPNAGQPIGGTFGDTNPWDASKFIVQLIKLLGKNYSDEACKAMEHLKISFLDEYTDLIKTVQYEQKLIRSEHLYIPPTINTIKAFINNNSPQSISDLQTVILDELSIVQAKVMSDDAESWRGFLNDQGKPFNEERCRDHLIGLLRQGDKTITYEPEAHVANDKEVDITCAVGNLRLPIEIKGQWHPNLWIGADQQLDKLYTTDWRAEGRGIYLVLWFGKREDNKKLKTLGRGKPVPNSPQELLEMLISNNRSAQEKKVKIVVLDINHNKL